jgi:hypothetical protein
MPLAPRTQLLMKNGQNPSTTVFSASTSDFGLGSANRYRGPSVRLSRRLLRALEYLLFGSRFVVGAKAALRPE